MNQIQTQKEAYYKKVGVAPGVPTEKGAYGDPENTKRGYNSIIDTLGNHDVPQGWIQTPRPNTTPGTNPGAPVSWNDPSNPDDPQAGYGYIPNDTTKEETFFYHSDHLGSTFYITDDKGNITQYDAYLPYGELLVDEHSSSEELPYKFNGKEMDEETGLYYYGARYMNPVTSLWYGVDPLAEKYPNYSSHIYCMDNPIKSADLFGTDIWNIDVGSGNVVQKINYIGKDIINLVYNVSEGLYETRISSIMGEELSLELPFQAITQLSERETKVSDKNGDFYRINNGKCSSQIFEFLFENIAVEWMQIKTVHKNNAIDFITTSHQNGSEDAVNFLLDGMLSTGYDIKELNHNHPEDYYDVSYPSGSYTNPRNPSQTRGAWGDVGFARYYSEKFKNSSIKFQIYFKDGDSFKYIQYTKDSKKEDYVK